jgi:hypothetical protein
LAAASFSASLTLWRMMGPWIFTEVVELEWCVVEAVSEWYVEVVSVSGEYFVFQSVQLGDLLLQVKQQRAAVVAFVYFFVSFVPELVSFVP